MRRTRMVLGLFLGLLGILTIVVAGKAEAQPVLQEGDGQNCVACHTDKAALQELAVEPEEAEELSEGEG